MAQEAPRPSSPLQEMQRTFFGFVQETIVLKDELKKCQDRNSELEKQLEEANETIQKQHLQLLEAADIMKEVEIFEKNSNQTIEQLKNQLDEKRTKEQEPEVETETLSEGKESSNFECNGNSVGIIIVSKPNSGPIDSNNPTSIGCQTNELQLIASNLYKNVNALNMQEKRKHQRKTLNKIIDQTVSLVGCLSTYISENLKTKIGSHSLEEPSLPAPSTNFEIDVVDVEAEYETQSSSSFQVLTNLRGNKNNRISTTTKHGVDFMKDFYCICGHKSVNKKALFKHITIKRRGNPFGCEMCTYHARDTTALNLHYKRVHQVNRSYANGCAKCGKMFNSRQDLLRHKYKDKCNNLQILYN